MGLKMLPKVWDTVLRHSFTLPYHGKIQLKTNFCW